MVQQFYIALVFIYSYTKLLPFSPPYTHTNTPNIASKEMWLLFSLHERVALVKMQQVLVVSHTPVQARVSSIQNVYIITLKCNKIIKQNIESCALNAKLSQKMYC